MEKLLGKISSYISKTIYRNSFTILCYHRVADEVNSWEHPALKIDDFRWQIEYLSKNYNIMQLSAIIDNILKNKPIMPNTVAITFDDGYIDNYNYAYPILKEYNAKATIFIATEAVDSKKMLWWDKVGYIQNHLKNKNYSDFIQELKNKQNCEREKIIEELAANNQLENDIKEASKNSYLTWEMINEMSKDVFEIGLHTHTHPIISKMEIQQFINEMNTSIKILEENANHTNIFAYPNGKKDDYNKQSIDVLGKFNIKAAVTTDMMRNNYRTIKNEPLQLFELSRIIANENKYKFMLQTSGIYSLLYKLFVGV